MLKFAVSHITHGGRGPVVHLIELVPLGADAGAKIELYLPRGYDVPKIAQAFEFAPSAEQADMSMESSSETAGANTDPLAIQGTSPSSDAPADTATTENTETSSVGT
jgi:hypothetical protein